MVISSVVMTVQPGRLSSVRKVASKIPGVDVFAQVQKDSKLILVLESETLDSSHELVTEKLEKISGVLNVQLAYCHFEENVPQEQEWALQ